ncbi:MAG: DUF1501 domain-containing protein [Thiotrichaceae bacterium]|nr:DUF1501 domain-containing protein [Thiotrichaceae bacterium]PCI14333.1 MAG: hypothetical protein COB71_03140 [Thiotrichales bacterium]
MERRQFLKHLGVLGGACTAASMLGGRNLISPSMAALNTGDANNIVLNEVNYVRPTVLPQIIHVFLYGGPSELAGNLTNIEDINANSQNPYPTNMDPNNTGTIITPNNFWGGANNGAGGEIMESLIAAGDMSIYRTINRLKEDSKAHRTSIFQNLTGHLDAENTPGIGTTVAAILSAHNAFGKAPEDMILPFVSFEGDSLVFEPAGLDIPLATKYIALDQNFRNPYDRNRNSSVGDNGGIDDNAIEALARNNAQGEKFLKVREAFTKRKELSDFIDSSFNVDRVNADLLALGITYPNTNFGRRLKAAVSLAVNNPDSLFISMGSGGLGGWDDHDSSLEEYPDRMRDLMTSLEVAVNHMNMTGRDNIIINVYGEFGRNVNLNNSIGWDHGNNQNLMTFGGKGISGRGLGKIVGKTQRIGASGVNRQFTSPTDDSYQAEPFSIASTVYKYFGVQNTEVLNDEQPLDENAANEVI